LKVSFSRSGIHEPSACFNKNGKSMSTIIALHGFLGAPSDWDHWQNVIAYPVGTAKSLNTWAEQFNQWVEANTQAPRILVGYSMGGRLALHALIQNPDLFAKAILISTHPGLTNAQERKTRLVSDKAWAYRFRNDPWDQLMADWENQPVFKDAHRPIRVESEFNREVLAEQLENFSLAQQEDLLPLLPKIPIQWVTGSKDTKFEQLAKHAAASHPTSTHRSIEGGTHRVLWEALPGAIL
jgi:2-succinyl-6-hydroxy-2,4-cyclohexadiene-1-carboxylate synthase